MVNTIVAPATAENIAQAAAIIRRGGLVAFPTETVYGLGADALNPDAVAGIFAAKERPAHDPLIVHIATTETLPAITAEIPAQAERLAAEFWPGPLSLILPKGAAVPPNVTANLNTVAVRLPAHPIAQTLIRLSGTPIAAPSANRFGHISPTTAHHVFDDLVGRIDMILDAGPTRLGVESTVLDATVSPPVILRPGAVTLEALQTVLGRVELTRRAAGSPKSPGQLDRHYAPHVPLTLVVGERQAALNSVHKLAQDYLNDGYWVGVMLFSEDVAAFDATSLTIRDIGSQADYTAVARTLYMHLRSLEALGVQRMVARSGTSNHLGLAIQDRLLRAATRIISL